MAHLPAKFDCRGAHFFLFQLTIAPCHLGFHLIDVEPLAHSKTLSASDGTRAELAPLRHGALGCDAEQPNG